MDASSIDRSHDAWPVGLRDLPGRFPRQLRVRGALPPPDALAVAIVGSREASPAGIALARAWACDLARRGLVIWSGGAVGIDTAAHEGALDAGGRTVAVLGSGLARPFPPENVELFHRIASSGGAVVSCIADDTPAGTFHFLRRNGVIAACTRALVVVEADVKSGARSAAAAARGIRRPVAVVPFGGAGMPPPGNVVELTDSGAHPVFTAEHVDRLIRTGTTAAPRERKGADGPADHDDPVPVSAQRLPEPTDAAERQVLELVRSAPLHVDAICERTGRLASAVGRTLFALAVEGHVREVTPGVWGAA